jgi:hypothetical protein
MNGAHMDVFRSATSQWIGEVEILQMRQVA